jgi:hypothetical protein
VSGNEHLIVSTDAGITVVPVCFYHMLPDEAKSRVNILATCPDAEKAAWIRQRLPDRFDVRDVIVWGGNRERN